MYGQITINGISYVERFHVVPFLITLVATTRVQQRIVLEADAPFLLKYLARGTATRFRVRLGTSDSALWFVTAGVNQAAIGTELVRDDLMFGDGQFPFPLDPPIFYPPSSAIVLDLWDYLGGGVVNIDFAFIGSKLLRAA